MPSRLLFVLCLISLILACKQKTVNPKTYWQISNVDSLIKAGKQYQNAHIDSLPPIAQKLMKAAQLTGNKTAVVYSELFSAHYFWQSANHKRAMEMTIKCLAAAAMWQINMVLPEIYVQLTCN